MDATEGKRDEARKRLSAVVASHPANIPGRILLAQLEKTEGKTAAAIEQYRKAVALDERNVLALNSLAYLLAESKQPDEALKYAQQAKEIAPDSPAVDDTLGWTYFQKGMYALAVTHLESATAKEGHSSPEIPFGHGLPEGRRPETRAADSGGGIEDGPEPA